MKEPKQPVPKIFCVLFCIAGASVLIGLTLVGQTWAVTHQSSLRQTVPLTPPATWTPVVRSEVEPTKPRPPTRTADEAGETQGADPWLGLGIKPQVVAPRMDTVLSISLVNQGDEGLTDAQVSLKLPDVLDYWGAEASNGRLEVASGTVYWTAQVPPQGESTLQIRARVAEAAVPDQHVEVEAILAWPGGVVASNRGVLDLPVALLP